MEQDFSKKVAIIVRRDLEPWQITNTISHIAAFFGNKMKDNFGTGESFDTKDGISHSRNSQYAIMTFSIRSREKLSNFVKKVRESNLSHMEFFREMIETTDDSEIVKILANKNEEAIEYLGVGVYGPKKQVEEITKKLSLWK